MQFLLGAFLVFLFPVLSLVSHSSPLLLDEIPHKAAAAHAVASLFVYKVPQLASFYAQQFHGRKMANRRTFNMFDANIAAHRDLPLGTHIRVTNLRNGRSLDATVQDRGPYAHPEKRILDLSWAAARRLDFIKQGLAPIQLEVLSVPAPKVRRAS